MSVELSVMRAAWPGSPGSDAFDRTARCATCGAAISDRVVGEDARDHAAELLAALAAAGCPHTGEPFVDAGDWFDPRTEWSRELAEPGLEGSVHGFFPTQGYGTVDGLPWYYRNRGGDERLAIGMKPAADATRVNDEWRDTECGWCLRDPLADDEGSIGKAVERIRAFVASWRAAGGPLSTANMVTP